MLQKIRIKNYQSLRDIEIALGKFTVIVGESDVGKSALVRAIQSPLINRTGQDFIAHGAQQAAVALQFDDGSAVAWLKDQSAKYKVSFEGQPVAEYTKMGRDVPDEVAGVLKMGAVRIGDEQLNVNVHGQFDQPFLITATPSLRARLLGELSGINLLYLGIQEARRREGAAKKLQQLRVTDLEKAKERLQQYSHLPDVHEGLKNAAIIIAQAEELQGEVTALGVNLAYMQQLEGSVKVWVDRAASLKVAQAAIGPSVDSLLNEVCLLEDACQALPAHQASVGVNIERVAHVKKLLSAASLELETFEVCPTCGTELEPGQLAAQAGAKGSPGVTLAGRKASGKAVK